jgi:DNA-binding MarR family transcriptional regulator
MITSNKLHKIAIEKAVDETGLRRNKHHMLMHLAKHGAFSSQKEIAERLGITPAAVTMTLSSLEKDGLIARKSGQDTRFNEITITDKGLELVSRSRAHFQKVDRAAFDGISEGEVEVLESCLDKMIENLSKETEETI